MEISKLLSTFRRTLMPSKGRYYLPVYTDEYSRIFPSALVYDHEANQWYFNTHCIRRSSLYSRFVQLAAPRFLDDLWFLLIRMDPWLLPSSICYNLWLHPWCGTPWPCMTSILTIIYALCMSCNHSLQVANLWQEVTSDMHHHRSYCIAIWLWVSVDEFTGDIDGWISMHLLCVVAFCASIYG